MKKTALVAAMAVLVMAVPAASRVKAEGSRESRGPIAISSDRMETDDAAGVVHFMGAVVARQGSMTLTCDRMKVFYTAQPPGDGEAASSPLGAGNREIDRVEAFDRVKMVDGDRLAVGDHAIYLAKEPPRRLILTGNARVWQGRDSLTGHRVIYYLDDKRSVAESKPGAAESVPGERVTTIIHGGAE